MDDYLDDAAIWSGAAHIPAAWTVSQAQQPCFIACLFSRRADLAMLWFDFIVVVVVVVVVVVPQSSDNVVPGVLQATYKQLLLATTT